ncbi:hypothetical protein ABZV93_21340 [Actinopolymorpha sp. NPDC004070]|uniref:hypothetical protein n=1 Tax=Actinopolymorpha sp. NPDC004070 TaxID=3154548 RepID=UPI0033A8936F
MRVRLLRTQFVEQGEQVVDALVEYTRCAARIIATRQSTSARKRRWLPAARSHGSRALNS